MKRIFICLVAVVGLATAVTLKASQKRSKLSEMALSNIEALSSGEYNEYVCFGEGDCWSSQKPGYGYYRCGVPCVWVDNFSGDGNASKCFR